MKSLEKNFKVDFIGIGAPKSGTTWIYESLRKHSQICMSRPKGTHYFNRPDYKQKADSYLSCFRHCKSWQIKGEFTPTYFLEEKIWERIKEYNPEVKLIACLRNPIERAHSQYLHATSVGAKSWKSFEEAIRDSSGKLLVPGFYYKYLKKFFDNFPEENILILIYEDIKDEPVKFIQKIYEFLKVDSNFSPDVSKRVSPAKFKLTKLGKVLHKNLGRPLGKTEWGRKIKSLPRVKKTFYKFTNFYISNINSPQKPSIKKETRDYLRKVYKEDIENLENLINRDLSFWK